MCKDLDLFQGKGLEPKRYHNLSKFWLNPLFPSLFQPQTGLYILLILKNLLSNLSQLGTVLCSGTRVSCYLEWKGFCVFLNFRLNLLLSMRFWYAAIVPNTRNVPCLVPKEIPSISMAICTGKLFILPGYGQWQIYTQLKPFFTSWILF